MIGFSVFGFLVLVGLALLTVWVFRKVCHGAKDYSDSAHKKILRGEKGSAHKKILRGEKGASTVVAQEF